MSTAHGSRNAALRRGLRLCAYEWGLATVGLRQHDLAELLCFTLSERTQAGEVEHYLEQPPPAPIPPEPPQR